MVSNTGVVTGIATGTATITVNTVDGNQTATTTVTVTENNQTGFIGYYNIISRNSNKGLDVADNSVSSGARIQQYDITNGGGNNQRWKFEDAGNGNYYIKVKSSQMCLVPENNSSNNGVKIVQKPQVNSNLYKWTITSLGGEFYKIINVNTGKSLDVEGVSTVNGANIQVWDYSNNLNQQWQFIQVESTANKEIINDNSSIENENITVFLNPDNNTLIISSKINQNGKIVLCAITGEKIIEAGIRLDTMNNEAIDISSLKKESISLKLKMTEIFCLKKL
ncbi:MAG: RICIN domain-containing protein [Flavobacterium sp.]|nr:RICIN domain-containing protein [Flavobacterium sp.]